MYKITINLSMSSKSVSHFKEWFPHHIINGDKPIALLVLNQPLNEENKNYVKRNWKSAVVRIAVDGGAVQLKSISDEKASLIPDIICGDFDSVTPEILEFFQKKGVPIIHTPDQDYTDFTKALRLTVQYLEEKQLQVSGIVTVASNGDRLDHILGNLNTLYVATDLSETPVFILGNYSLTWLLPAGSHKIHVSEDMMNSHVGLIPLGKECTDVSTTGLKWNLGHSQMKFGGLISICNRFDGSDFVTVITDTPLIWTMEINAEMISSI